MATFRPPATSRNVAARGRCGSSCVFGREKLYWVASRQVAQASGRKPTFLLDATDGGMPVRQCPGCLRSQASLQETRERLARQYWDWLLATPEVSDQLSEPS